MNCYQPQRAILLCRISDARDGDDQGVQRQEKDGRRLADHIEWTIGPAETHVIVENDVSAYHRRAVCRACDNPPRNCTCPALPNGRKRETVLRTVRPEFRRALAMLRSGEADGLIAADLDRACRDPRDLEDLIDTVESRRPRIEVKALSGNLQLDNDGGVTMARVQVSVKNQQSRDTASRVASKRKDTADRGGWGGGTRPYGWGAPKLDPVTGEPLVDEKTGRPKLDMSKLVESEAAEVRRMAEQLLSGVSQQAIVADLRARGVPTVTGAQWGTATVRDILLKPRNAGFQVYQVREAAQAYKDRGEPVPYDCGVLTDVKGGWEPILSEDKWRAVATLLTSHPTGRGNTPKWLGSVLFRCGVCAGRGIDQHVRIGGSDKRGHGPGYTCAGPVDHLRRAAPHVDEYVSDIIVARLSQPDAAEFFSRPKAPEPDRDKLHGELLTLRERSGQLAEAFADGAITSTQLRDGSARLNSRIKSIETILAARQMRSPLDGLPLGTGRVVKTWAALPLGSKRAIVDLLMTVTLNKGKPGRQAGGGYFDESSVVIDWKS